MAEVGEAGPAPERLHALDAVRGLALLLGIVLHVTLSFIPAPSRIWIVEDTDRSSALAVLFFAIHVFRMTTFFLIAGFFAHMSFHRRGASAFIKDRLRRIALPLLVGWPVLFAAVVLVAIWVASIPNDGRVPTTPPPWPPVFPRFPLIHLWFLYVLLEFYAAMLVLRAGVTWLDTTGRLRSGVDRLVGLLMRHPLAPAILAVPIAVAFTLDPTWSMWFGVRTPDLSLATNLQALVGFGTTFSFGWLLHRQIALIQVLERRWMLNLVLAMGLIAASLAIAGLTPRLMPIRDDATRLAGAACYALATWTTTFAVIGLALRFLSGFSLTRRSIADASYWLYLIHLPDRDGAAGRGLPPRLALAGEVRGDRLSHHVRQLPAWGALQLHRRSAERPPRSAIFKTSVASNRSPPRNASLFGPGPAAHTNP